MDRTRTHAARIRLDDGMTIVEIMVAVTILFIVVTAMLPMLLQTTKMSSQAKAETEITNAVSSYIEEIRALSWNEIATVGDASEPSATVETTRSITVEGYTVTMATTIAWVDDPALVGDKNYKQLTVDAVATAESKPTITYSTSTYIWGSSADSDSSDVPLVMFTSVSPSGLEVVHGESVWVGGHAEAVSTGADIVRMVLKVDSEYLPNSAGAFADFVASESPYEQNWLWDTTKAEPILDEGGLPVLDGDGHPEYLYFSPDGKRVLKVEAWDTRGLTNYVTRVIIVDNYAPSPSASASLTAPAATTLACTWAEAMDGTDPAAGYNIRLRKASTTAAAQSTWAYTSADIGAVTSAELVATPFSRYFVEVQSESARGLVDDSAWVSSSTVITRPVLTGSFTQTVTKSSGTYKIKTVVSGMDVTDPAFATSGVVTYDLWRSESLATLGTGAAYQTGVAYGSGTWGETIADGRDYANRSVTPAYYYLVRASFTPYGESSAVQLWTNIAYVPGVTITGAGTISGTMTQQW